MTVLRTSQFDSAAVPTGARIEMRVGLRVHVELPWLVLPLGIPCQLALDKDIAPVPNTKPWLRGVLNVRGNLAPVFDLGHWRGLAPFGGAFEVLVIAPGQDGIALMCSEQPRLLTVQQCAAPVESDAMMDWVGGAFHCDLGTVFEFDPRRWIRRVARLVPGRH